MQMKLARNGEETPKLTKLQRDVQSGTGGERWVDESVFTGDFLQAGLLSVTLFTLSSSWDARVGYLQNALARQPLDALIQTEESKRR